MATTETPPAFTRWLRKEMTRRGYALEGPRAGGTTRFAADAGISRPTMSRLINGGGEPSIDSLRRIGRKLGYTLPQMLKFAELADPGELRTDPMKYAETAPPDDYAGHDPWYSLTETLRAVWHIPGLTQEQRLQVHHFVVAIQKPAAHESTQRPRQRRRDAS